MKHQKQKGDIEFITIHLENNYSVTLDKEVYDKIREEQAKEIEKKICKECDSRRSECKECFVELKAKNRRLIFNDTGIDDKKAEHYLAVQNIFNVKVLLVFIDDDYELSAVRDKYPLAFSWFKDENGIISHQQCTWYGNFIEKLWEQKSNNPIRHDTKLKITYFPLSNMNKIIDIFKERQTQLNFRVID